MSQQEEVRVYLLDQNSIWYTSAEVPEERRVEYDIIKETVDYDLYKKIKAENEQVRHERAIYFDKMREAEKKMTDALLKLTEVLGERDRYRDKMLQLERSIMSGGQN